ncbi:MAG: flagellin N-terminal helical domain-containing protein [Fimbriimonadaceae bacterium]
MSLSINTNLPAMTAITSVEQSDQSLQTSIQRLSTGLRINSPVDDPSGFVLSEGMKSQLAGMSQATQNTQSAINLTKTAAGAMSQIAALIQTLRGLAVSSANGAVADASTLQANQTQLASIVSSIDQIAASTQFGSQLLLNGSAGVQAAITDSADVSSLFMGATFGGNQVQSGPVTVQRVSSATQAQFTTGQTFASAASTVAGSGVLVLNGYALQVQAGESIQNVVSGLNAAAGQTGVTAQLVPAGGQFVVQLTQESYGSQFGVNLVDPGHLLTASAPAPVTGTDAVVNVSVTTKQGVSTVAFTGGRSAGATGLQLTDGAGNTLTLSPAGNSGLAAATQVGVVTAGSVQFQVGANASQAVSYSLPSMAASALGTGVVAGQSLASLDISSTAGANTAIQVIDGAVTQVALAEGQLGSFQANILQSSSSTIGVASQNLTAASSTLTDANVAAETTNFTKNQVLEQSGLAILAQANQNPTQLLSLLKNL